jgi:putative membrane protein
MQVCYSPDKMQTVLPAINATLNGTSGVLLLIAYVFIRRRNIGMHKRFMLAACTTSLIFLACYVLNHILRHGVVTRFPGTGWIRPLYFTILVSHTILAITIVPMAILSVRNGLKMRVAQHRRIARWTFPLWMYVSVTGVLVYFFLYQWYPSA